MNLNSSYSLLHREGLDRPKSTGASARLISEEPRAEAMGRHRGEGAGATRPPAGTCPARAGALDRLRGTSVRLGPPADSLQTEWAALILDVPVARDILRTKWSEHAKAAGGDDAPGAAAHR